MQLPKSANSPQRPFSQKTFAVIHIRSVHVRWAALFALKHSRSFFHLKSDKNVGRTLETVSATPKQKNKTEGKPRADKAFPNFMA